MNLNNRIIILILLKLILILILYGYSNIFKKENFTFIYPKLYVINLKDSKDRWELLLNNTDKQIQLNRIDGINGKNLKYKDLDNIIHKNSYLYKNLEKNRGEIGCALSHLNLWKQSKQNDENNIIILEDDVIIDKDLYTKLNKYLNKAPKNWDIIFLGGSNIIGYKINKYFIKPNRKVNGNVGLFGMLINKNGINKLLKYCQPITKSLDHQIKQHFDKINAFYLSQPLIFHNNELNSDRRIINKAKHSKASIIWRKLKQNKITILG